MRAQRVKAIARKELLQVVRDPRSLMIALLMPLFQMVLLGYGVSLDIKHIPVCTFDREASQHSEALLKRFQASTYFRIVEAAQNYQAVTEALDYGRCKMAIVVPPEFSERLNDSGKSYVQLILDATDDNTANIGLGYAQSVVSGFSNDIAVLYANRQSIVQQNQPVTLQSRVWFNEDLDSRNFIIPGVVAMVLALVGAQLTSLTIAREWERGTMEVLISTPVTALEVMIGKIMPYFMIGLFDAAFCLALAVFWFQVPFRGTLFTLFFTTSLFLVVVLGVGYLISVAVRSQIGASQVALLVTLLPTSLLSGYTFPIDQMPAPVQVITYLVPSRYYVTIVKAIFLKGAGIIELALPITLLSLYALVIGTLAARAFRKRLD
ncbi:MAG: ABC transporter permease [Beijerinckiaceae bacterium]|jgi:ABC-2 type transport system permease protein